jgi:hypothetical protein
MDLSQSARAGKGKRMQHNIWPDESPLPIPEPLTFIIERILDGRDRDGNSYTRPANARHVRRCDFCGELILPCILSSGREYNATAYVDQERHQEVRVDIELPHLCAEARRYQEFLAAESEPEEGF